MDVKKLKIVKVILIIVGAIFTLGGTLVGSRIENKYLENLGNK